MQFWRMQGAEKRSILGVIVLIQLLIIGSIAGVYSFAMQFGQPIWVKTAPYDPSNPFYGHYYNLNFTISRADKKLWKEAQDNVYDVPVTVALAPKKQESLFKIKAISMQRPVTKKEDTFLLKGTVVEIQNDETNPKDEAEFTDPMTGEQISLVRKEVHYPISRVDMSKWKSVNAVKYLQEVFVLLEQDAEENTLQVKQVSGEHPGTVKDGQWLVKATVTNYAAEEFAPIDLRYEFTWVSPPKGKSLEGGQTIYVEVLPVIDPSVEVAAIYSKRPAQVESGIRLVDAQLHDQGDQIGLTYGFEQYFISDELARQKADASGEAWVNARISPWGQILAKNITFDVPVSVQE
jgi:uncharacterized membrane-anchored protein